MKKGFLEEIAGVLAPSPGSIHQISAPPSSATPCLWASGFQYLVTLAIQNLDVSEVARQVAGPPDAIRILLVDFDAANIGFRIGNRKFHPGVGLRIEARRSYP